MQSVLAEEEVAGPLLLLQVAVEQVGILLVGRLHQRLAQ
jgi:hypothetical protein